MGFFYSTLAKSFNCHFPAADGIAECQRIVCSLLGTIVDHHLEFCMTHGAVATGGGEIAPPWEVSNPVKESGERCKLLGSLPDTRFHPSEVLTHSKVDMGNCPTEVELLPPKSQWILVRAKFSGAKLPCGELWCIRGRGGR